MVPADYSSPSHLLSPGAEAKALMQMNPEWKLAENPNSFAPQMHGGAGGGIMDSIASVGDSIGSVFSSPTTTEAQPLEMAPPEEQPLGDPHAEEQAPSQQEMV
jgi:hypothetical protein